MEALRRQVFERDGSACTSCGDPVIWETGCTQSGHMHHVKAKRMGLDTLDNVRLLCGFCHSRIHNWGPSMTKPCKSKGEIQ